ncbi:MAG TPA: hypothetical protein VFX47_07075, partial [Gammaproteobacteria bacterium]|nr:hypothetical protein [Gammaproteobacteria bacterium]
TAPPATLALGNWMPSVTAWEGTEHTISHTANGSFDVEAPNLLVMKAVSVITDPVHCTTPDNIGTCTGTAANFKSIPGSVMRYLVNVSNQGKGPADGNTLAITDPIPANSAFVVGSVTFADGSPTSGLTLTAGDVKYSSTGSTTCTDAYPPTADANGTDPNVTNLCFAPQGSMAGSTGTAPSFSITFKVMIK